MQSSGITLSTHAETQAVRAQQLSAFSGFSLHKAKRVIGQMLDLIGRDGLFDQYTPHDISHIDTMLAILDWLVPDDTKLMMTPADWLLIVLGVYLHDIGLLVTRDEYNNRHCTDFELFIDKVLYSGPDGQDYRARLTELSTDEADRFLYQEFVRYHHATRVRAWIDGAPSATACTPHTEAATILREVLQSLPLSFRRDLALLCESHHLNDLNDLKKYRVSQPYGNSDAETANLHYAALLLRATDLLDITSSRSPSVQFRLINPADPVSQLEWAKQAAVTRVRPMIGLNDEGLPDPTAPRDTIEIYAYFTNTAGFFGLTSYLQYVDAELKRCCQWSQLAARLAASRHSFPWRRIDATKIETRGFLSETFAFELDQARILDLLTGHTLYNDSRVVVRELAQNAIDAVRFQTHQTPEYHGYVHIEWDTRQRRLTITDNGSGMTQAIIRQHLLKVGASRYQDPDFRKQYPRFSPISRFGIGILSCFMISDSVEIVTCHPDEPEARQMSLRSVHGRYLVQLLDKTDTRLPSSIVPHGTSISLRVRPSIEMPDLLETVQRWIVQPRCQVTVSVDSSPPQPIGYERLKDALTFQLTKIGVPVSTAVGPPRDGEIRVAERSLDGVTLAYGITWSQWFQQWEFLDLRYRVQTTEHVILGTCVEGIRVRFDSPGFARVRIAAMSNASGDRAPRTNVARSGIEDSSEYSEMLQKLYRLYCDHVRAEMTELVQTRHFSPTWASVEALWLLRPIVTLTQLDHTSQERDRREAAKLCLQEVWSIPLLMVEDGHRRVAWSVGDSIASESFWTVESGLMKSTESLLRQLRGNISLVELESAFPGMVPSLPQGSVICNYSAVDVLVDATTGKEVGRIVIDRDQRRVDLLWVPCASPARWRHLQELGGFQRAGTWDLLDSDILQMARSLYIANSVIDVGGVKEEGSVSAFDSTWVFKIDHLAELLLETLDAVEDEGSALVAVAYWTAARAYLDAEASRYVLPFRFASTTRHDRASIIDVIWAHMMTDWPEALRQTVTHRLDSVRLRRVCQSIEWSNFTSSEWHREGY